MFFQGKRFAGHFENDQYLRLYVYKSPRNDAIDNPDRFEQVFDTYYIPEVSEKIFMDDISMVRP